MDKINFYTGEGFPMYRGALAKMQDISHLAASLAIIGGKNFILTGCDELPSRVIDEGLIVVNGELLPFEGGEPKARITIKEQREDLAAFGVIYPEVYVNRTAIFSDTGEYNWSDFERLQTNAQLYRQIKDITGDSAGMIKEWAGLPAQIPADYMLCDGRDLAIKDFPDLYKAIGIMYGGDGLNSFKIPNASGRFTVGYSGIGEYSRMGAMGGEEKHTLTESELPKHDHTNGNTFNKLSAKASDVNEQSTPGSIDKEGAQFEYNVGICLFLHGQRQR